MKRRLGIAAFLLGWVLILGLLGRVERDVRADGGEETYLGAFNVTNGVTANGVTTYTGTITATMHPLDYQWVISPDMGLVSHPDQWYDEIYLGCDWQEDAEVGWWVQYGTPGYTLRTHTWEDHNGVYQYVYYDLVHSGTCNSTNGCNGGAAYYNDYADIMYTKVDLWTNNHNYDVDITRGLCYPPESR